MLIVLDRVDSTNAFLKKRFAEYPDGTSVAALEQTAGRGRLGRVWRQTRGNGIALSTIYRQMERGFHAGVVTGLAALETIREALPGADFFFKWPNDLYAGREKLAGILSEGVWRDGKLAGVVCGIGINVNDAPESLVAIGRPATSLFALSGRKFDVKKLLAGLEKSIVSHYIRYGCERAQLLDRWRAENRLIGQRVELTAPDGQKSEAEFAGIDEEGNLVARCEGEETLFRCGDVRIIALPGENG